MRVGVLGGYGNTGFRIARLLAVRAEVQIVLMGRDETRLRGAADGLSQYTERRIETVWADAEHIWNVRETLEHLDLLIVASSSMDFTRDVAEAAVSAGTDYFDTNLSSSAKISILQSLEPQIRNAGLCFITDGGYHPGIPAAMVRFAARRIPGLRKAMVGGRFGLNWRSLALSHDTVMEFVDELKSMDMSSFRNGEWVSGWQYARRFDFGPRRKPHKCVPMGLFEMRELPAQIPSLRETGFFVAGFGWVVDYLVMPLCFVALSVAPGRKNQIGRFFLAGLKRFASSEQSTEIVLEAEGGTGTGTIREGIRLFHGDPYEMTAVPVAACVLQYLDGARKPGLWTQGNFVEPFRFFRDLETLGIRIDFGGP